MKSLNKYVADPKKFSQVTIKVRCYRGEEKEPRWMDAEPGMPLPVYELAINSHR